jgi:CPA2 family monovalent cation:H+ antiporter-2
VVIEQNLKRAQELRRDGVHVVYGDAGWPEVLGAARPETARLLIIAVPERGPVRRIVAAAREANADLDVVVRTHSEDEAAWLETQSIGHAVLGERHTANEIAGYALQRFGRRERPRTVV